MDGVAASRSEVDVRPTDRHGVRQRVSGQFHQHSGDYWRQWLVMEGRRKTSLGDPKKLDFFSVQTTTHDLTHFSSADFHEIFARTRGSVSC